MNELQQALLAAVPADGSSIGNQSLLERLKSQVPQLSEEAFWAARDGLIEQGVLQKGRGRGGSVLRAQPVASSLAEQVLSKARERLDPAVREEEPGEYVVQPSAAVSKGRAAKVQPATGIEDMKKTLWATADKLRANMDAAEYKHIVLGLIFLKYISDSFAGRRAELERRLTDENDDYYLGAHALDGSDPEALNAELEDRDYYREVNVFWVPEVARWESIRAAAKQVDIGKRIDEALAAIEAENSKLKNILDKRFARVQLPDGKLGELVDLISTIGFGEDIGKARDLLGQVYEYFLGQFASAEGRRGGQFYTPASIVKTLVAVLNPHHGKVYDPCCGSGGMFVQSEKFIEAHGGKLGDVSIYGQEANPTTWRLAAMNLAIRGIDFNLGKEPADTFVRNQHSDLRADFVLANPPFNISDWWHGSLEGDPRWVYGTPPQGNANYAWLQHMLYHLKPNGRAGIVLANGSMSSSQNSEGDIRKAMVEADVVEVMVALPGQLFFNTQIPACLWFLAKDKRHALSTAGCDRSGQVLFIDARKLGTSVSRVQIELTDADIERIAQTVAAWRGEPLTEGGLVGDDCRDAGGRATQDAKAEYADIPGYCRSVTLNEIAEHGHVLTPGRYVGAEEVEDDDEAFAEKMQRLTQQLGEQMQKGAELDQLIRQKLGGLGYEL
ncbi:class I SAM-dependent DNA methyltransferase [Pseudomonas plecoglossicida]|uniref:class I SAM-dependent DNA methyltransferase n=1 Tax=Pseudomonas TaxID=286 RepID=UPI001182A9AB|nr:MULTISPECIES: class I SAM-dependent DNA methyltransferase [Pseudomonas]MDQ7965859.1 class I SAM-dependent DNA methyltransferase [Pseudomonas plecoglossicida]QDR68912.1 type I restriction-modification system subunit M [Pseudomonas sp. BJP69]WFG01138.1 class I SAM-dependent DNA methyltransferase [Pseudomonas putida]WRS31675.1 class I SAM-dependent DNA methyltransferase [Pseudomonas aeruginosa]